MKTSRDDHIQQNTDDNQYCFGQLTASKLALKTFHNMAGESKHRIMKNCFPADYIE